MVFVFILFYSELCSAGTGEILLKTNKQTRPICMCQLIISHNEKAVLSLWTSVFFIKIVSGTVKPASQREW